MRSNPNLRCKTDDNDDIGLSLSEPIEESSKLDKKKCDYKLQTVYKKTPSSPLSGFKPIYNTTDSNESWNVEIKWPYKESAIKHLLCVNMYSHGDWYKLNIIQNMSKNAYVEKCDQCFRETKWQYQWKFHENIQWLPFSLQ